MSRAQYINLVRQYSTIGLRMNRSYGAQILAAHDAYTQNLTGDGAELERKLREAKSFIKASYRQHPGDPIELAQLLV